MYIKLSSLGLLFAFLLSAAGGITQIDPPPDDFNLEDYDYVPGQLLVQFKPTTRNERANEVLTELGVERIRKIKPLEVDVLRLPPGLTVEKALEIFSKRAEVAYAEPNYILELASNLEAEITDQWGLQKIEAQAAWAELTGTTPALLAVVDTGIDPNNPDLEDNIWINPGEIPGDGLDNDNNGYVDDTWGWDFVNGDKDPMDDHMHGTAVSSVAAGNQDGQGVAGVCPWCEVMAVKVMDANGAGQLDVAANGIIYAASNDAKVINLSLSASLGMQTLQDAIDYAWAEGALVVAAAGNNGTETVVYPAGYQHAMAVASTDINDHHSCFSNYSDGYVSVAAPGSNVLFAYLPGGTATGSGTSLSTPHVVGLAGLLLSQDPTRTNQDLWTLIEESANDLGPVGDDAFFGAGRINALRAVTPEIEPPTAPPEEDFVLVEDATGYAHARKLARSSDGNLHMVWYEQLNGSYMIQYAQSQDDGATWSAADTIFSSSAETYHPAIALDRDNLFVVFPSLDGASAYQIYFTSKPVSGGSWSEPTPVLGGGYHAVRPDIYLDPSNNRLHLVASSFDNARYAYYRSSDNGGSSWSTVRNVDFAYYTRYASVYAYGDNVYIASRTTDGNFLIPTYSLFIMRSLDGGANWQDRMRFVSHLAFASGEYGVSLGGFEDTLYILYEHDQQIRFGKSYDGVNWDTVIVYSQGGGKWPTVTATPDGKAWLGWLNNYDQLMIRKYIGGPVSSGSSYNTPETLYGAKFPNFKENTNYGKAEWVSTNCNGAPFSISYDFRADESNMPPLAFMDAPESVQAGVSIQFDASASYDPDGQALSYAWDFGDGNTGSGPTPSYTFSAGGVYTVTLTLTDSSGGTDTAIASVTVEQGAQNQPPTANIGGPYSGSEDAPITFDASGSWDPDGDALTYAWDFGDGSTGSGVNPSHTYAYGGTFTVSLTVSDGNGGEDSLSTTATIQEVNDQPVPMMNDPYAAGVGEAIFFDASSSYDPDNQDASPDNDQLLTYHWDFGDGNTSTAATTSHSYASAGEFTVTLTIDDGDPVNGTAILTATASITDTTAASMHAGDLDGSRATNKNRWTATVYIFVHDEQEQPVSGAVVTGTWSNGFDGPETCTTDSYGWCEVSTSEILKKDGSADFTIDDISHNTLAYAPGDNHDPDTDSDGTTITVYLDPPSEPTPTPTPPPPPPSGASMHIGDLDGTGVPIRTKWEASVTILVHDENENPLAGVSVTGSWDAGGEANCTTGADGTCSVTKNNLKTSVQDVTFTITEVVLSGYEYLPGANHDPDGDSDLTFIVISAP